jgi:hypothetical protein
MDRQALIRWISDNKVHLLRDLENELIDTSRRSSTR